MFDPNGLLVRKWKKGSLKYSRVRSPAHTSLDFKISRLASKHAANCK